MKKKTFINAMQILFRKTTPSVSIAMLWICAVCSLKAQNDSTLLLQPERLGKENILLNKPDYKNEVYTATRSLEKADDLPFQVWVITAEEIRNSGFVTLVDVLKAAPGIRVSQPGSAMEGETFLMRGLSGNQYVKILINDVPVKPGMALGMPIGAQLPIRQAERIEVMYGPASAQYGNEACVGVVNIILKETERPVYAQADLSFGNNGYNSLDLMFGGKLGKDENILRYSIFGSSTVREQPDLFFDDELYNMNNYLLLGLDSTAYTSNGNYMPSDDSTAYPRKSPLAMESRMFGGHVRWRGLQFAYYRMARNEHAALGMNPFALSYTNSSNRLSERIETYALSYNHQRTRREATHLLSVQRYRISNTSTISHIFDRLNWMAYEAGLPNASNEVERKALFDQVQTGFGQGVRYGVADAVDVRFETRHRIKLNTNLNLELGGQIGAGFGTPLNTYYTQPVDLNFSNIQETSKPFNPLDTLLVDVNTYGQLHYRNKHLTLVAGANVGLLPSLVLAPRLALLYRFDSSWAVWANGSGGYRQPSVYANANSIVHDPTLFSSRQNSGGLTKPERVYAGEFGVRYTKRLYRVDLSVFLQESYDLLRDGMVYPTANNPDAYILGFAQPEGRSQRVWGIQALFRTKHFSVERNRSKLDLYFEFFMQRNFGTEWAGPNIPTIDAPLNMPSWQTQMRYFFTINKVEMVLASNRQKEALSKSVLYADRVDRQMSLENFSKFRTWDVTTRLYLSNHFSVYLMFQNLFNREYTGLDATGTPDDLLYPVQQRRQVRFGVNYSMR